MNALGSALPVYPSYGPMEAQRYPPGSPASAIPYQLQNAQQYAAASMGHSGPNSPFGMAYSPQFSAPYAPNHTPSPQNLPGGTNTGGHFYSQQGFVGQNQQGQQFFMQPSQYIPQSPVYSGIPGSGQFGGRTNFAGDPRLQVQRGGDFPVAAQGSTAPGRSSSIGEYSSIFAVRNPKA